MSKQKSKEVKSTPEIYQGLSLTIQRPNICIVEDLNGNYSLHNSRADLEKLQSFSALIKDTLSKVWNNFNKFLEENKQTILAYHEQFFKVDPEKNQTIEQTAVMVWNKIISIAKTDLTTAVPIIAGRKSTIGLCEYRAGTEKDDGNLKTPQARICLKLFKECLGTQECITEAVLRQHIIDHASELHTHQDPWRIFQYYRPELIAQHLIIRK